MSRGCANCDRPLVNVRKDATYCTDACRQAAWKRKTGYSVVGVYAAQAQADMGEAVAAALRTPKPAQNGKQRRSGRQVSYWKAVDVAKRILMEFGHTDESAQELAELWMREALPARQREQHQREERRPA